MKNPLFSSRAVILLIACATALAAASTILHARGGGIVGRFTPQANSHSVSAIGHAGFYDLLRRLGRPVSRSAGNVSAAVGRNGTLIVANPIFRHIQGDGRQRLTQAPRLLFVLPKWRGTPDTSWPSWISEVTPIPLNYVNRILGLVTEGGSYVFHRYTEATENGQMAWTINDIGANPYLSGVVQLIRSEEITPVVGNDDGILLGKIETSEQKIFVLSDPDILSNHGIIMGDNAAFMLEVIDALRHWNNADPYAAIVFDAAIHGFREQQASPLALLFGFPFVIVTILACIAALLLVLSGMSRFGAPLPSKPALDFGKANLISNGARLLDYAGHHSEVLVRYIGMTLHHVASTLRAPAETGKADKNIATIEWLDRIGRSRGVKTSCANFFQINSQAKNSKREPSSTELNDLFENAKKIHDWKQEILKGESVTHGPSNKPQHRY